jgi:L1 cell adhesion molecule like protein
MPRGVPQIEVSFDVDANGILNVSAAEKSSGKSNKITITNDKGRLSKEDIERMVEEAEKNAAEDKLQMERVESKNKLESYLYNTRNSIREEKVKETLGSTDDIESWIKEGIEWLETNPNATKDEHDAKYKWYEDKIKPVMMKLYENSGMSGGPEVSGPEISEVD